MKTIAMLHPGEMGAAVGACLVSRGHRVVWASAGRSPATVARAKAAGLEDAGTVAQALQGAEIVFSICPPHAALAQAKEVAACGYRGIYVDANAVAPKTVHAVQKTVEAVGAQLVDGGIIGSAPNGKNSTRIYLSGKGGSDIADLFKGSFLDSIALDAPIGAASALKMCYAAWTKGATALLADIRSLAQAEGVEAALLSEWAISQPATVKRSEQVTAAARKAWRWIAEMEEIASSFEAVGLPGHFHHGASEIYRRLDGFKDIAQPPAMQEILAELLPKKG